MGRGRLRGLARRTLVVLVTLAMTVGQWLAPLGLATRQAFAAEDEITGTCSLSNGRYVTDEGYTADCTMPNGQVLTAHCYEKYLGDEMHEWYIGPCDGDYGFTATRQDDGSYFVVIHSEGAEVGFNGKPANGIVGHKFQRAYVAGWRPYVDVSFSKCSADVSVTNGNGEYRLDGAEYDIHRASDNALIANITTDASGHASYQLSPNEHYYAVETKAPQGFQINPNRIEFSTGNSAGSEQLVDDPGTVRISINKKDLATLGEAQPGASLEGAEFKVTSLSTPGWEATGTTNAHGRLVIREVPLGKIVVTETKAPAGYRLDPTSHTYEITHEQKTASGTYELDPEDDFREAVKAFDLEIAKTKGASGEWDQTDGQSQPAAGVQFQVISNTTGEVVGTLTTNASGFASTRDTSTVNTEATSGEATYDASTA